MSVGMRKILDKYFLPVFYGLCIIGVIIAVFFFLNVKQQQKDALLAYENNLNIHSANETLKLESSENFTNEELIYSSSDESIIRVDKDGNLVSVGEGSAVLTISTKDQKQTQALVVNVGPDAIKKYLNENPKDNKETAQTTPVDKSLPELNNDKEINTIEPTSITLDKTDITINLNTTKKTEVIKPVVMPENTSDKTITWISSDKNIATVKNGVITAKKPGNVTITATTSNNILATANLTITKEIAIVVGESQVTRMADYKDSYVSKVNSYKTVDNSLVYISKSGSGVEYQTTDGYQSIKKIISGYSNAKEETKFHIFFPLSGNTIKDFTCDEISSENQKIIDYAKNYNNVIAELTNNGYNVQGYVVSMHPVKTAQTTSDKIVNNESKKACSKGYHSNWKYYQFNKAIKSVVEKEYTSKLTYESLFVKIMETNENKNKFTYKMIYNTTDGIHWDKDTTSKYVDMMLEYSGNL